MMSDVTTADLEASGWTRLSGVRLARRTSRSVPQAANWRDRGEALWRHRRILAWAINKNGPDEGAEVVMAYVALELVGIVGVGQWAILCSEWRV